jgi:hypothetical protein
MWRGQCLRHKAPELVRQLWAHIVSRFEEPISAMRQEVALTQIVLELAAIADQTVGPIGTPVNVRLEDTAEMEFRLRAETLLQGVNRGATLCSEIDVSRGRVLPKIHTPQSGLTTRSLSLFLAYERAGELTPEWIQVGSYKNDLSMNLLIVPWPFVVHPAQFRVSKALPNEMLNMPDNFGFFTYEHKAQGNEIANVVEDLIRMSEERIGPISGVILPELAVNEQEFFEIRERLQTQRRTFLIGGVGEKSASEQHGRNEVRVHIPAQQIIIQAKHHRWKLDRSQIVQYGIGSQLHPGRAWWEHIGLENRRLSFISLLPWLTISVLVCEDLARPDPVGDLLRAVGPNLVIALLMDAPQLKERWPGRYAMVLADDPGSSVLSVTSLGMSYLSRPTNNATRRSRVIALWKDPESTAPVEIDLPEGQHGAVLSLSVSDRIKWSADGRSVNVGTPTLSGVHFVELTH